MTFFFEEDHSVDAEDDEYICNTDNRDETIISIICITHSKEAD